MMFKNSFRLFCANFDKVWKYLIYQLLCLGVVFALLAPFYNVISSSIVEAWNANGLKSYFSTGTFYGIHVSKALSGIVSAIVDFFAIMFGANVFCGVYVLVIILIVKPFLSNIGKFTICEMMYGYMSSCSKTSFTGRLLGTLKKSLPYAILKALYTLPFDALICASIFGLTRVQLDWFEYVLPIVIVLVPDLFLALKETFVAGWAPAKIVFDEGVVYSYKRGMHAVFRRGFKVYSTAFVIFVLTIILFMVLGAYSLIIILPCITPLLCMFEMVSFFSSQGMRFYVDSDTIKSPKKLEEVDKINKAKYLL